MPSTDYPPPLRFNAIAGTTYRIVVAGYNALDFRLSWRLQPPNDDVSAPVVLTGSSGKWTGDNLGASGP